jgi:LacI family transcriptional regulator
MSDVAREAGVSLMTVSRVVNDKGEVSAATRQRVLEIIEQLGYRPSGIARGLATNRTGTLGLVVPDVANPFFSDVARGVEHVAYGEGYNVFLCNTEEDTARELAVLQSLEEKRVDGVVVCSSRLDDSDLTAALAHHASAVLLNRRLNDSLVGSIAVGTVIVDDEFGGRIATQHLLDSGHRAIAFLAGPPASRSGRLRRKGYHGALVAAGLDARPSWVRDCSPQVGGGQAAAYQLLAEDPGDLPEPTALLCYNDLVAVGALQACADLGRRVPGDIAVVGFDGIPLAALVTPPLTTCQVSRYDLGAQAVRLLLDQIAGCQTGCDQIVVRPELVVRASAP